MEYREIDYNRDAQKVVDLINSNLKSGFTVDILKWKHLYGAFGPSYNVIAVDGETIAAVVFAMRYNYVDNKGNLIKGIRTFDGCTDPKYRGQGIFKKLMREVVGNFSMDYDFLMANPNKASYPEHIKLGYVEPKDEYYYKIGVLNPFGKTYKNDWENFQKNDPAIFSGNNEIINEADKFVTGNTLQFINWRYQPSNYLVKSFKLDGKDNYICYRKIRKKGFNVLVICDFFGDEGKLDGIMRTICKYEKTYILYFLQNSINKHLKLLFSKKEKEAVIVFKLNNFSLPDNLTISLADLEGRL